jgi:predicted metal-dependent phosphoesterase TrpH
MSNLNDNERQFIDLHVHSSASDGTFTPAELVEYAEQKGLYAFALTDHDTVDGVEEALAAAQGKVVKVIPGIEISAEYGSGDLHILGLNVDYKSDGFLEIVEKCRKSRDERNRKMIARIREQGMALTEEIMEERFGKASVTRAHFARYMMDEGYVSSKDEAFARYLNPGKPCYVPREKISPEMAISLIRKADGHAVLAHPLLYKMSWERVCSTVNLLKEMGLEGIEAMYSLNTPSDDRKLAKLAENQGLFITGGSDFHGSNKPTIDLGVGKGNLQVPKALLNNIGLPEAY